MPPRQAGSLSLEALSPPWHQTSSLVLQSAKGQETFLAEQHQPHRAFVEESNASRFGTQPSALHRAYRRWAGQARWALLLCWGSPAPEIHFPWVLLRGEAGLGSRRPSATRPQPCHLSQHVRSVPRHRLSDGPKLASGSCILQRETLLGQQTTAPMPLGSGKQRKPFSPPGPHAP